MDDADSAHDFVHAHFAARLHIGNSLLAVRNHLAEPSADIVAYLIYYSAPRNALSPLTFFTASRRAISSRIAGSPLTRSSLRSSSWCRVDCN